MIVREELRHILRQAPSLPGDLTAPVPCKLCGEPADSFTVVDFHKSCNNIALPPSDIAVRYHRCQACELIFTGFFDEWSHDEFARHIYNAGYAKVDPDYDGGRAKQTVATYMPALAGDRSVSLLDYGAGRGVFAAVLRSDGFARAVSYDPFVDRELPPGRFDVVTSFEAVEHSTAPLETLDRLADYRADGGCILIGQSMQPTDIEHLRDRWWYIAPRNGHVSFYSHATMEWFAKRRELAYVPTDGLIILHGPAMSDAVRAIVAHFIPSPRIIRLYAPPASVGNAPGWHGCERGEDYTFRWTSDSEVPLGEVALAGASSIIEIPVAMAVDERLREDCLLRVGASLHGLHRRGRFLAADLAGVDDGVQPVSLITPKPLRPCDRGASGDNRLLGLAVKVDPDAIENAA